MKVALVYWATADESAYGAPFFPGGGIEPDEWHYPIDKDAILPVGTVVNINHENVGIDLRVVKHFFSPEDNLLRLQVVTEVSTIEARPDEFVQHIQKCWIPGLKIDEWAKMP